MSRAQQSHASHTPSSSAFSYQSKPSLLAGVQDAYWSDDEEENSACPLCIKELDLEEQSFKPCPCGYQICLFCWHHIRDNMNARCPACRREYTEEAVVWKPVAAEDSKRVQQQKRRKEKERKELETLGRKPYLDVRIVQRNVVYVLGLGPRFAKEETITVLRSNDYFGRYGKISRIQLQKRSPPGAETPIVGLYITYVRREDAERAIQAIDGSPSPSGGGEVMRASFGTAKYCISFLRSVTCTNNNCLDAHEWGEPDDCFTREELATLKHTIKDTEKLRSSATSKKNGSAEAPPLPRAASWAARTGQATPSSQTIQLGPPGPVMRGSRQPRQPRNVSGGKPAGGEKEKRRGIAHPPTNSPAAVASPPSHLISKPPGLSSTSNTIPDATSTEAVTSTAASSPQQTASIAESGSASAVVSPSLPHAQASTAPGLAAPPGLALPSASLGPSESVTSPNPLPAPMPLHPPPGLVRLPPGLNYPSDQMSPVPVRPYHLSKQAKALIDDVRMRREAVTATPPPVFPDFDRTLASLLNSSGFSFSFTNMAIPETTLPTVRSARKTTFDPFASPLEKQSTSGSVSPATRSVSGDQRRGSFNPFGEDVSDGSGAGRSRFDFARRQASLGANRDNQGYTQSSRGSTPFKPDLASGNTLYNSSDAGYIGRQATWPAYPTNEALNDFRHLSPASGPQFQTPLSLPLPPANSNWPEMASTPFNEAPMSEHMRDLVRGFETPSIDGLTRQSDSQQVYGSAHQQAPPAQYYQSGPYQGQGYSYQSQLPQRMARDDPSQTLASQRSTMKSPVDGDPMYSSYHQQPSGVPNSMVPHQQNQGLMNPVPGISQEITSPNVSQAAPISVKQTPVIPALPVGHPPAVSDRPMSPQVQLIASDNKEEFPALPSAAPESSTNVRPPQPPIITKPPPAPPVIRKASAPVKSAAKPEVKKPGLPPLATTVMTKGKDKDGTESVQIQSPAVEVTSTKTETKGKKTANDTATANTPVIPAASATKGGKHAEATSKVSATKSREAKPSSSSTSVAPVPEPVIVHAPILARQTKKTKPQQLPKRKPIVPVKEDPAPTKESTPEPPPNLTPVVEAPVTTTQYSFSPSNIQHLLAQLHEARDLRRTRFFNEKSLKSSSLDNYGPIVDALASISLAVSGGAVDASTADAAMIAFLQLHSALMDMILELRNMMPQGYWSDNQKFEAVLQDMRDTKANGYYATGEGSEGMARKAQWMHTQLVRLEELHSSINLAAVRYMLEQGEKIWQYKIALAKSESDMGLDLKKLESELAIAQKDVQSSFEELREVMTNNAKLITDLA